MAKGKMGGNIVTPPGKPGKDKDKPKYGEGKVISNQKKPRPVPPKPKTNPVVKGPKVGLKEKIGNNGRLLEGRNRYLDALAKRRQQRNRTLARPVPPMKGK